MKLVLDHIFLLLSTHYSPVRPRNDRMTTQPKQHKLAIYQAVIFTLGAVLFGFKLPVLLTMPRQSLLAIACLCLMIVLASAKAIMIPLLNLKFLTGRDTCVTASDAITLFMIVAYGDAPAVCAAGLDGLIGSHVAIPASHSKRWLIILRSMATMIISISLSSWVTQFFLRAFWGTSRPGFFYPLAGALTAFFTAAFTHFLTNAFIVASFQALKHHRSIMTELIGNYLWMGVTYVPAAFAAWLLYLGMQTFGWVTWLVTLPVFAVFYLSFKLYHAKMEEKVQHAEEINAIHIRTIEALAKAVDAKDQVTHDHIKRVQTYALGLARLYRLPETDIEALRAGALLHDIGKLAVPDYILNKPGKLTTAEFDRMKIHTTVGAEIITTIGFPYPVAPIVRHHHERWDGRGYPDGLKGEDIPLTARILTLVDSFDALTDERPYSKPKTREGAITFLREHSGQQFDPQMVELFIAHLDEFDREVAAMAPTALLDLQTLRHIHTVAPAAVPGYGLAADKPSGTYLERISSAHREFNTLYHMAQSVAGSLELDTTLGIITEQLHSLVFFDTCIIYLTNLEGGAATARYADGPGSRALANRQITFGEGITGWVLAHQEHFYNTDPALDLGGIDDEECEEFRNLYVFPLIKEQEVLGAIALYSLSQEQYTLDHVRLIEMATPIASEAVNNALRYAQREEDALTDELTGLANSRAIYLFAEKEISRCRRASSTLTVLMMDLDRFKQVNDIHGHRAGSRMLSELGPLIARTLRTADFVARYGGDEFFALLPDTGFEQAQTVIQRIEEAVNAHRLEVSDGQTVGVGISIGAAELGRDGDTLEELLIKADLAMYTTKAQHKLGRHKTGQLSVGGGQ